MQSEKDAIENNTYEISMMTAFMAYVQKSKGEIDELNKRISSVEIKINHFIDEMWGIWRIKKIEITRDRRLEEIKQENKQREDQCFSTLEIYRRK